MATQRLDVEKFTGENDFHLWRLKMRALLVHQGIEEVLEDPRTSKKISKVKDEDMQEAMDKAHSTIILSLGDGVLREVGDQTTAAGLWKKLEDLYTKKSLTKRLSTKKRLYTLQMEEGSSLTTHIDAFNRIILDLEDINVKIEDEDKAIILLSSLPHSYEHFVDTLLYGRQSLAMQDVKEALSSKESFKKSETKDGEGLTEGHFKRDCPERKIKPKDANNRNGNAVVASEDSDERYDSAGVLVASNMQTEGSAITGDAGIVIKQEQDKTLLWHFRLGHESPQEPGLKLQCTILRINRCPSTAIELKTPYEVWSGKLTDYTKLRIFGCTAYAHIKQGKLELRALKCAFLGYPSGTKGYKLWCVDLKPPKYIISRDVIFNQSEMLKNQTSAQSTIQKIPSAETPHFEVELLKTEDGQNTSHTGETQGSNETSAQSLEHTSIQDNQLTRDRQKRQVRAPERLGYADLIAYALTAAQKVDQEEPKTYEEAVACKESAQWIKAMEDEMDSLNKNGTWKLIQKPE
ncbi:Integrase catalytic domain-containing protein [Citrus sinensis]|uniref:Integrase catalytic domain-containing protein n=1 Tax=Citrus sinensis TaxID=2711 RepID=A0ACB8KIM6_CITSI|nr:Integrase catalytic domain-containing protein [Citrus sinensis]